MNFPVIKFNTENSIHSIVEAGYKYVMPSSLYSNMRLYLVQYPLVSGWYKQLTEDDREKVERVNTYIY